jgi:hypothetical protein
MPSSPKEFREFAEECLRRADETKSERHRKALLSLATTLVHEQCFSQKAITSPAMNAPSGRAARLSPKTRTPPQRVIGAGSREPSVE